MVDAVGIIVVVNVVLFVVAIITIIISYFINQKSYGLVNHPPDNHIKSY